MLLGESKGERERLVRAICRGSCLGGGVRVSGRGTMRWMARDADVRGEDFGQRWKMMGGPCSSVRERGEGGYHFGIELGWAVGLFGAGPKGSP
jgi:hypothetical protein